MIKKLITPLFILLLLLVLPLQSRAMSIMPPEPGYFYNQGVYQYYTVYYDEEGEATVIAKLAILNTKLTTLNNITIELPSTQIRIINAIQEWSTIEERCRYYETKLINGTYTSVCAQKYNTTVWPPKYQTTNFTQERLTESTKITFKLPHDVKEQETATIILTYKIMGTATQSLGVWTYNFPTLTWKYDTDNVRVNIIPPNGYVVRGQDSNVAYQNNYEPSTYGAVTAFKSSEPMEDSKLASYSRNIGYYGNAETAYALDPWESFHVTGEFAKNKFYLYMNWYITGFAIFALLIIGGIIGTRKIMRKLKTTKTTTSALAAIVTGVSFAQALLLTGMWAGLFWFLSHFYQIIGYNGTFLIPVVFLFVVLATLFFLIAPPVYIGITQGWQAGLFTFAGTIVWSFLMIIITILVMAALNGLGGGPIYY